MPAGLFILIAVFMMTTMMSYRIDGEYFAIDLLPAPSTNETVYLCR